MTFTKNLFLTDGPSEFNVSSLLLLKGTGINKLYSLEEFLTPPPHFREKKHGFHTSCLEHLHLRCYTANSYFVCFRAKSILALMKYALPWYSDGLCILIKVQTYQGCQTCGPGRQHAFCFVMCQGIHRLSKFSL